MLPQGHSRSHVRILSPKIAWYASRLRLSSRAVGRPALSRNAQRGLGASTGTTASLHPRITQIGRFQGDTRNPFQKDKILRVCSTEKSGGRAPRREPVDRFRRASPERLQLTSRIRSLRCGPLRQTHRTVWQSAEILILPRLLKKVQMQGAVPHAGSPQMHLFQLPSRAGGNGCGVRPHRQFCPVDRFLSGRSRHDASRRIRNKGAVGARLCAHS
jgi:hypothetical protein